MQTQETLLPQLFKTEYSKLVAVLCKYFGFHHIADAEDIVSDTFLKAAQTWGTQSIPPNPTAWLYTVAQNKARDTFRRKKVFEEKIHPEITSNTQTSFELDMSIENIQDSQLKMMFVLSNTDLTDKEQIALSLKLLCGFGTKEIALAFLSQEDTIAKRLYRAKEKMRSVSPEFQPSSQEINKGLETVLTMIYLLFNEGYFSTVQNEKIRTELCKEALRLALILDANNITSTPQTKALIALMCFHSSRLKARETEENQAVLLHQQDKSLWDQELINKGEEFLNRAAKGDSASRYHLEAAIAYWHTQAESKDKWQQILQLYDMLSIQFPSSVVTLNRAFAVYKVHGSSKAIVEAEKSNLNKHHLYHALLAHLHLEENKDQSLIHLKKGLMLAVSETDQQYYAKKINELSQHN